MIQVVLVGRLLIFGIDHRVESELRRAVSCNKSTHQIELGAAAASDFGGSFFLLVFFCGQLVLHKSKRDPDVGLIWRFLGGAQIAVIKKDDGGRCWLVWPNVVK